MLDLRVLEPEQMDNPLLALHDLESVLKNLHFLNRLSFTAQSLCNAILDMLMRSSFSKIRLLDVGCGSGETFCDVVELLRREGIQAEGVGIDMNSFSIKIGNEYAKQRELPVQFRSADAIEATKFEQYDIVTSTLFLHHLPESKIVELFSSIKLNSRIGLIMCDLERAKNAYILVWLATRILSRSSIIHQDGLQSVKAAFKKHELLLLAEQSGLTGTTVKKIFPCQLMLSWKSSV